jgi:hypothetical protein
MAAMKRDYCWPIRDQIIKGMKPTFLIRQHEIRKRFTGAWSICANARRL